MYGHGAVSSSSGAKRPIASAPAVAASAVRHHASHVRSAAIEVRCQTSTAGGCGSGAAMRRVYAGSARWARTEAASSCVKAGNGPTAASTSVGQRAQVGRAGKRAPRARTARTKSSERSRNSRAAARSMTS